MNGGGGEMNLVPCSEHGPSMYCHVNRQPDATRGTAHVDPSFCQCNRFGLGPLACPIDTHNPALAVAESWPDNRPSRNAQQTLEAVRLSGAKQGELFNL